MGTRVRAKSIVKLVSDSGVATTWEFQKGLPLDRLICDLITFGDLGDLDQAKSRINAALDEKSS